MRVHRNSLRGLCAASAATVIANFNALSEDQEPVSLVPVLYEPCSVELVTPSGKNLNPDNIVINNCALRVAILQLHALECAVVKLAREREHVRVVWCGQILGVCRLHYMCDLRPRPVFSRNGRQQREHVHP